MSRYGKVWGVTEKLFRRNNVEIHRFEANAGSHCSLHKHEHKTNLFYVESGKLKVEVHQNDYDLVDETILEPGDVTEVGPGVYHRFVAIEDTVCYEIYWVTLDERDIVREDVGSAEESFGDKVPDLAKETPAPDWAKFEAEAQVDVLPSGVLLVEDPSSKIWNGVQAAEPDPFRDGVSSLLIHNGWAVGQAMHYDDGETVTEMFEGALDLAKELEHPPEYFGAKYATRPADRNFNWNRIDPYGSMFAANGTFQSTLSVAGEKVMDTGRAVMDDSESVKINPNGIPAPES